MHQENVTETQFVQLIIKFSVVSCIMLFKLILFK